MNRRPRSPWWRPSSEALAAGALLLGGAIERSPWPWRWYAGCEAVIAVWSLVLAGSMAPASGYLLDLIGPEPAPVWQWSVAFGGTFLLLLPATAAMGATLPAMERVMAQMRRRGSSIGALYAANTFGAVAGVLAAAFWLVPAYGLMRTAWVCFACNFACAAAALTRWQAQVPIAVAAPGPSMATRDGMARNRGPLAVLALTGLLGIGYEVVVVRVLSQVSENTVYTFAMLLVVYLVGTAFGATAYQRRWAGMRDVDRLSDRLLHLLALACLIGMAGLWGAEQIKAGALSVLGVGMSSALATEALLAVVAFLPATLVMGALFSHLCAKAQAAGHAFGLCIGVNTLGAAFAPWLAGVLLVPALGPKLVLLLVAFGYQALAMPRAWRTRTARAMTGAALASMLALALWAPPLAFVDVPEGGRIVSYRDGAMASVSVVEDDAGVARLRIDNRQQEGSSATLFADARQALLPLLLHPAPRRALFLGLGTGVTASSAALAPRVQVDAAELLPEVIAASPYFTQALADGGAPPRLHLVAADARRFVRSAGPAYDLIVADNFHPARSGSGSLYTVEHFRAVRHRLAPGGLFCQWLPLHQLDLATLRSIVRSFVAVYPNATAMLATNSLETPVLGLVARGDGKRLDGGQIGARLAGTGLPRPPAEFGIADGLALFGGFIAGPRALARFAGDAPLNTDDHPVVAYLAPRITYAPDSLPRDRLLALLGELHVEPGEVVAGPPDDDAWATRLSAYWKARDRFIEAGRDVQPSADVHRMLAQVREPLLSALRVSPDFRPAYDPLLMMAGALARTDVPEARTLLGELARLQPARPEAMQMLERLAGEPG